MLRIFALAALLCASEGRLHSVRKTAPESLKVEEPMQFSSADASPPMFTKETMPEVSPTLKCVINLTVQYFVIYTALFIVKPRA